MMSSTNPLPHPKQSTKIGPAIEAACLRCGAGLLAGRAGVLAGLHLFANPLLKSETFRRPVWVALMLILGISQASAEFRYNVERDKFWGRESGVLTIGEEGIQYRSENENTAFDFAFENVREADLSDPRKIQLYTYDRAKKRLTAARRFEFNLREGTTNPELVRFLSTRLERPVVGVYLKGLTGWEMPAYHRHVLKGCHGVLRFGSAGVAFDSKDPKHSRSWIYEDIQTIGTMNPFHFRLTSYAETFNFDLKKRLLPEDYRAVWRRAYKIRPTMP